MRRPRISIAGLLGLIAALGFGLAALRGTSSYWLLATALVNFMALLTAILGVLFRRGRARIFWIGFALFGWAFLFLFDPSNEYVVFGLQVSAMTDLSNGIVWALFGKAADLNQEGIVILEGDLLFAFAGGFVARALASRQESEGRNGDSSDPRRTS